jgi:hypothetical protein
MILYTDVYIYIHTNCSCSGTLNQPTMTAERDFIRKYCRKLTVLRFSWTLRFSGEVTFHLNGTVNKTSCNLESQLFEESIEHQIQISGTLQRLIYDVA